MEVHGRGWWGCSTYSLNRYSLNENSVLPLNPIWDEEPLWTGSEVELHGEAIAEDGSVCAEAHFSRKVKGRRVTNVIPYHLTAEGRRPLVDIDQGESAIVAFRYLSRADVSGEEELIMGMGDGTHQVYQPNAGFRFELPLEPWAASCIGVSPPALTERFLPRRLRCLHDAVERSAPAAPAKLLPGSDAEVTVMGTSSKGGRREIRELLVA